MHWVHIHFHENRSGCCDRWQKEDILGLLELTEVTSVHKPGDVVRELGPPEAFTDNSAGHVKALVAESIVHRLKGRKAFIV